MIMAGTALGRMTHKVRSAPTAALPKPGKKNGFLGFSGWINAIIPVLIVPYYSVNKGRLGHQVICLRFCAATPRAVHRMTISAFIADGALGGDFLMFAPSR